MKKRLNWESAEFFILLLVLFRLAFVPSIAFAAPRLQGEDPQSQAEILFNEGDELLQLAQYQAALEKFEEALPLYQKVADRSGEAECLLFIGFSKENLSDFPGALEAYRNSLPILKEMGEREGEAETLNQIGVVYENLGQYSEALDYYQQMLTIFRELGDRDGEGMALNSIGFVYSSLEEFPEALDCYQQALTITQELRDQDGEEIVLYNIGRVYANVGQYQEALDYYQQSLSIAQKIGDRDQEGANLNSIGRVYADVGQYQQALASLQQALRIAQETGDREVEGTRLNNIGGVYAGLEEYQEALDYYQQALIIARETGDQEGEGTALVNIGGVYEGLVQNERALDYYHQALPILQEIGDRAAEQATLNNIGSVSINLVEYEQALVSLQQALTIARDIGRSDGETAALNNIGRVYTSRGEYEQALDYLQQALTIAQAIGDRSAEGVILNNIAGVYDSMGQYLQALEHYQRALATAREVGDRSGEGITLNNVGYIYAEQGDIAQAIQSFQQAVETLESVQGKITVGELKASFAAEQSDTYGNLISLLWDEGRFEEAFNYAERARARAFLDQLGGGRIDFRAGTDADLLESEQALRSEISALRDQLDNLRAQPSTEGSNESIAEVANTLAARESDYAHLLTEIKLHSPEVASLVSVDVAPLEKIQSLLDTNTTLVEYFILDDRILAFIITRDTFETVKVEVNQDDLARTITAFRDFANLDEAHPASLKQLYEWLIAPLKNQLKTPVVGIVPHGTLHYVPFAALTDGERYLGEEYSLFTLPSASVLRFIQEKRKPDVQTVLALGNPVTELPDLQSAEREARFIASLYDTQAWIGRDATESTVRAQASDVGILHLAAHGEYNPNNPLFSAIHLAGDSENDGRLEVHEIFGLDLTKATDLVVLSACETNVGTVSAGDEVVGLNRAFLYAGTPTVTASLWNVDDEATALLMEQFYTRLREGLSKGEALRQAQVEVRAQYPHPYYWAAFVLTGDAGSYVPQASTSSPVAAAPSSWLARSLLLVGLCFLGLITVLAGGLIWWQRRKRVSL